LSRTFDIQKYLILIGIMPQCGGSVRLKGPFARIDIAMKMFNLLLKIATYPDPLLVFRNGGVRTSACECYPEKPK